MRTRQRRTLTRTPQRWPRLRRWFGGKVEAELMGARGVLLPRAQAATKAAADG
jgi:hypothetical protein